MHKPDSLILEIFSDGDRLKMCMYEKQELSPSFKTYNHWHIEHKLIQQFSDDIFSILNKQDFNCQIEDSDLTELKKTGQLLYDHLLTRTIKKKLKSYHHINLILVLDEELIYIPWELLYDGSEFLCLKFNLGRSIKTEKDIVPHQQRDISYPLKMLVIADPEGSLKSAYQEGLQIKNYLKNSKSIDLDFKSSDVDSLYLKKHFRDYDIIHFAGHVEYDDQEFSNSGWLLSDGKMKTESFSLMAQSQPLPGVIFANGCQSTKINSPSINTGNYKHIYSSAYEFLFSGVRHYIGTSWRVEDQLSFLFAQEFYSWIAKGKNIGEALRLSREDLKKRRGDHTIAWANYVLYGDPSFVLSKPINVLVPKKKKVIFTKKRFIGLSLFIVAITLGWSLVNFLPTLRPSIYFVHRQVKRAYLEGDNQAVIARCRGMIERDTLFLPAYKMLGDVYFRLGQMPKALEHYFEYSFISEKKEDYQHLASAYLKIAWVYHMNGDYPKAKEFYDQAIALSLEHNDKLNEADALSRLAVWYMDKDDFDQAFALLTQSSEINRQRAQDPEHKFNLACDYFNLAYIFFERDDHKASKDFYDKSFKLFEELDQIPELSDYYFNIGEVALYNKEYQKALEYYNKGLELDKKLNHRFNLCSDYLMIGEYYMEIDRFNEAEKNFEKCITYSEETNNLPILAYAYYDLGMMYNDMDQLDKAKEYLQLSLEIFKDIDTPEYQEVLQYFLELD